MAGTDMNSHDGWAFPKKREIGPHETVHKLKQTLIFIEKLAHISSCTHPDLGVIEQECATVLHDIK